MIAEYVKYLFLSASLFVGITSSEVHAPEAVSAPDSTSVTLLFAGDIMQHTPQITAAWDADSSSYNYKPCFSYVKPIISSMDIAIANLEVTLAGEPFAGYPQFSAPDELAVAVKDAGFDVLATANNHSCDRGNSGILRTIYVLDSLGIPRTGTFKDSADMQNNHPLIVSKNDITIALFNYTYGTNGLPFYAPTIVNLIDTARIIDDLGKINRNQVDFVVVFFHWGNEYQSQPAKIQTDLAEFTRKQGADVVIGSHPHVLQRMEYDAPSDSLPSGQLTVYSLGNYVSNQRDRYRDGGAMVSFTLTKTWNKKTVIQPQYHLTWVYTPYENGRKQYYILPVTQFENDTTMDSVSQSKMTQFSKDSRELYGKENRNVPECFEIL